MYMHREHGSVLTADQCKHFQLVRAGEGTTAQGFIESSFVSHLICVGIVSLHTLAGSSKTQGSLCDIHVSSIIVPDLLKVCSRFQITEGHRVMCFMVCLIQQHKKGASCFSKS